MFSLFATLTRATEVIEDQYPRSDLYFKVVEAIPGLFAAIGATLPPS